MKLITEHCEDVEFIVENVDGKKRCFIEGIFMQAEVENRNKRIYPKKVLESAVNRYITEQVKTGRAVGELNHPPSPAINLDKVSHKIVQLDWKSNDVYGKAMILNTPMGQIAQGLLEADVKLGVSSRGMGALSESSGKRYVKDGYILATIDIVQDPSCMDAMVDGILEGVEFVMTEDGRIEEYIDGMKQRIRKTSSKNLLEQQTKEFSAFLTMLKG